MIDKGMMVKNARDARLDGLKADSKQSDWKAPCVAGKPGEKGEKKWWRTPAAKLWWWWLRSIHGA